MILINTVCLTLTLAPLEKIQSQYQDISTGLNSTEATEQMFLKYGIKLVLITYNT